MILKDMLKPSDAHHLCVYRPIDRDPKLTWLVVVVVRDVKLNDRGVDTLDDIADLGGGWFIGPITKAQINEQIKQGKWRVIHGEEALL